ncbi:uncharacterized protein LOC135497005 [Lineus longissimus]|uniref:uncharacterized protein LOC135497005 n=1 Tax=Lineus longissimus TaxID=88925 RepID=UPI00315D8A3E
MVAEKALLAVCAASIIMVVAVQAVERPMEFIPPSEPCRPDMKSCEYWLHIVVALTAVHMKKMTFPWNGKIYYHSPTNNYTGSTPVNTSDVIVADGYPESRMLYLVNGTLPGPTLTVYKGQNITVHIKNHMTEPATSIHFHGIVQQGTPYADGVSFVTQCPIYPGQTFAHNFNITQPGGTYWYHAHAGNQRTMGIYGAFIIKNKPVPNKPEPEEHVIQLQDYNHDWSSEMNFFKVAYGLFKGTTKINGTASHDGGMFSNFNIQSGLINGLGRWYNTSTTHNGAPLTKFKVKKGSNYRLRVINAGALYPFRFSVDEHELTAVATDGSDVEPIPVESFIINPGERYDVMLEANKTVKNYMIRAQTLDVGLNHIAEAVLNYQGVDSHDEPTTSRRACTPAKPCKVLNCPFTYYPKENNTESNIECISVDQLRGKEGDAPKAGNSSYKQFFLNFAFPGIGWTPASVNGRTFHHPQVNPLGQMDEMHWGCDPEKCGEDKVCACTYHLDINYGDTVQMVFLNMGQGKGFGHPVHLHGHSFYVVKQGFAQYNSTTGKFIGDNLDINCRGNRNRTETFCNAATWSDSAWDGDNIPGLNLKKPPLKDTIIVPTSSYVIIRFKADNPGVWILHCHIEMHNNDGMAMMVREGKDRIPKPPKGFPTCRNFDYDGSYALQESKPTDKPRTKGEEFNYRDAFWAVAGILILLVATNVVIVVWCCCCLKREPEPPRSRNSAKYHDNGGVTGDDRKAATDVKF